MSETAKILIHTLVYLMIMTSSSAGLVAAETGKPKDQRDWITVFWVMGQQALVIGACYIYHMVVRRG